MSNSGPLIESRCAARREAKGLSAAGLATLVGVSRQTIYAIESGRYIPNTIVALKLARALDSSVEELFRMEAEKPATKLDRVRILPGRDALREGQPVHLATVGKRMLAIPSPHENCFLPDANAVAIGVGKAYAAVEPFDAVSKSENRIVIAGCDPGLSILARHARAAGIEVTLVHRNSTESLRLLKDGLVHIAGLHLSDNASTVARQFPERSVSLVSFSDCEVGLLTAAANPEKVRGVHDLTRKGIRFVNREAGSGARLRFDRELRRSGILSSSIHGYDEFARGHLAAASRVAEGATACCFSTRAAARRFGLGFVSVDCESYDLAIKSDYLHFRAIEKLIDVLSGAEFRRELSRLGYSSIASAKLK